MTIKKSTYILTLLSAIWTGCNIGAGTHGSIKGYRYPTTKDKLEDAVKTVIKNNPNIYRDTITSYIVYENNGSKDSILDNSYNDGINYVTVKIKDQEIENEYIFRFYGDEEYWRTSSSSEIFICYAYDKKRNGGSEGGGGINRRLKKELTGVFERAFVSEIDDELNLTHKETN